MFSYIADLIIRKTIKPLHAQGVMGRRVKVLANQFANLLPSEKSLAGLDVGCGSGEVATLIMEKRSNIVLQGVDVLVRKDALINVTAFDGKQLPFEDNSFDFVMLSDVLHHTDNPASLLKECSRVAKEYVIIKDHYSESRWDKIRLSFMDWVGNRGYGVRLPYNYLSRSQWKQAYSQANLVNDIKNTTLNLYPKPFTWVFDSTLHFVERLRTKK
jgi:ubiquinone/menaquinone biosynthesis C-methylase UbiE